MMYGEAFSYLGFYWCTISLVVRMSPTYRVLFHRIHHVIAHVSTEALNKKTKLHMSSLPREGEGEGEGGGVKGHSADH